MTKANSSDAGPGSAISEARLYLGFGRAMSESCYVLCVIASALQRIIHIYGMAETRHMLAKRESYIYINKYNVFQTHPIRR